MAIVAKAVFEKAAGKSPALGTVLRLDRYSSANKGLAPLASGGRLFLVTVRPPDEALWLVAVLDAPTFSGSEWVATACSTPLIDISDVKGSLQFESGKGLPAKVGTLGMSLQTPRVLTAEDVALLLGRLGGAPPIAPPAVDEARAELVALETALKERLSVSRRKQARARREELIAAHGSRWWPWPIERRHHAGAVIGVTADASTFLGCAAAVFAAEPVRELELRGVDEETIGDIAKASWLGRLSSLVIRGPIGDEGFATLVGSKHLSKLEALNVSMNELSAEGLAALKTKLPGLRRLCLTANAIGDEGAEALATWKHFPTLQTLYLSNCELSEEGVRALVGRSTLALEKLTLAQNELGDGGVTVLAQNAAHLPHLRYLELKEASIGDVGANALATVKLPAITHLDLRGNWCSRQLLGKVYQSALVDLR
jgi:hypothetical protein